MLYRWEIYLWENGTTIKEPNLTQYLVMPIYYEDRLNEELDTASVTLDSVPVSINDGEAFSPKTKFRLICYENEKKVEHYDMVVDHDDVEYYEGAPEICCHRISLIEASVIAQGMHVDNIALTYKLRDVTLEYKTADVLFGAVGNPNNYREYGEIRENIMPKADRFATVDKDTLIKTVYNYTLENFYAYKWDLKGGKDETNKGDAVYIYDLKEQLTSAQKMTLKIIIPRLYCYTHDENDFGKPRKLFELPIKMTIKCKKYNKNNTQEGKVIEEEVLGGAKSFNPGKNRFCYATSDTISIVDFKECTHWGNGVAYGEVSVADVREFFNENNVMKSEYTYTANSDATDVFEYETQELTQEELSNGTYYTYDIEIKENSNHNHCVRYKKKIGACIYVSGHYWMDAGTSSHTYDNLVSGASETYEEISIDPLQATFIQGLKDIKEVKIEYAKQPKPYNAYGLLRKAFLTVEPIILMKNSMGEIERGIDDINYPIYIHNDLKSKLEQTAVHETTFQEKNLWEVLLELGKYLHSIPYLKFKEGEDRYELEYKELGKSVIVEKSNLNITRFTTWPLSDFFSQYDAYVANLYSPENEIEELVVVKTSDPTYLVHNDTAELQCAFPIIELISISIIDPVLQQEEDITYAVCEDHIYNTFSNGNPTTTFPAKGNTLHYAYESKIITGLNYVAPEANTGTFLSALKYIYKKAFEKDCPAFNKLMFRIKYRTKDSMRILANRPDLDKFAKQSNFFKIPHNKQYYGQQEKIMDSERFSKRLYGELIQLGNQLWQRQEYVYKWLNKKEGGDLVKINEVPYYVSVCENEYYPDAIFQKVEYSKNFNRLSQIVTTPSEPRFYEVSERSIVRREICIQDFFKLASDPPSNASNSCILKKWKETMRQALFKRSAYGPEESKPQDFIDFPNYAYIKYVADSARSHEDYYGKKNDENIFLSSHYMYDGEGLIAEINRKAYSECIVPIQKYPMYRSLGFEWDMMDNFSAGSFVTETNYGDDKAYNFTQEARYVDLFGRADLMQFFLFYKNNFSYEDARKLPATEGEPQGVDVFAGVNDSKFVAVDKDNREALSFNYTINLLSDNEFVVFANVFGEKTSDLQCVFLDKEISLCELYKGDAEICGSRSYDCNISTSSSYIEVEFEQNNDDLNMDIIKAIALVDYDNNAIYMARNVGNLPNEEKLNPWYIYPVFND